MSKKVRVYYQNSTFDKTFPKFDINTHMDFSYEPIHLSHENEVKLVDSNGKQWSIRMHVANPCLRNEDWSKSFCIDIEMTFDGGSNCYDFRHYLD